MKGQQSVRDGVHSRDTNVEKQEVVNCDVNNLLKMRCN